MANQIKNPIIIPKEAIGKEGIVILPLKEYQKLQERVVPTYYLKGKEAKELDRLVEEGLREYERGESIRVSSLREALKIYERKEEKEIIFQKTFDSPLKIHKLKRKNQNCWFFG
jgi:phage gp29-like protein